MLEVIPISLSRKYNVLFGIPHILDAFRILAWPDITNLTASLNWASNWGSIFALDRFLRGPSGLAPTPPSRPKKDIHVTHILSTSFW